ncbi:serine/arginine repetitive matrix protein 3-like [Alligator mississippiensis]|uniref:serine/arginine repetitive matrix protein 3-like n=1 Tax=Alligator mississippiensis TaxID=8496 RepID=UPI002877C232|nr:serine/arginine repetitive matrix protein 3-like [Alligator mississippiensis]
MHALMHTCRQERTVGTHSLHMDTDTNILFCHEHRHMCRQAHTHAEERMHTHMHVCMDMHACTNSIHAHAGRHIQTCTCTQAHACMNAHRHAHTNAHACTRTHINTHAHMHRHARTCTQTHAHACTHRHMYTDMHIQNGETHTLVPACGNMHAHTRTHAGRGPCPARAAPATPRGSLGSAAGGGPEPPGCREEPGRSRAAQGRGRRGGCGRAPPLLRPPPARPRPRPRRCPAPSPAAGGQQRGGSPAPRGERTGRAGPGRAKRGCDRRLPQCPARPGRLQTPRSPCPAAPGRGDRQARTPCCYIGVDIGASVYKSR